MAARAKPSQEVTDFGPKGPVVQAEVGGWFSPTGRRPFRYMRQFDQLLGAGLGLLDGLAGIQFVVDGVPGQFHGVFNRHEYQETLMVGGFQEEVDATIVAPKAQFTGVWIPNRGKRLFAQNKAFVIALLAEDAVSFTFGLKGVNR
jgi:hypothetical protein